MRVVSEIKRKCQKISISIKVLFSDDSVKIKRGINDHVLLKLCTIKAMGLLCSDTYSGWIINLKKKKERKKCTLYRTHDKQGVVNIV